MMSTALIYFCSAWQRNDTAEWHQKLSTKKNRKGSRGGRYHKRNLCTLFVDCARAEESEEAILKVPAFAIKRQLVNMKLKQNSLSALRSYTFNQPIGVERYP